MIVNAPAHNGISSARNLAPSRVEPYRVALVEIADTVYELTVTLIPQAKAYPGPLFIAIPEDERVVMRFSSQALGGLASLPRELAQAARERLARRVLAPRGTSVPYLVVGYAPLEGGDTSTDGGLHSLPLNLAQQPSPFHVPIGMTGKGPLWLSILEMDSVLIGGARRMGKTNTLHGWIQALVRGGRVEMVLWDGKGGLEFGRYAGMPGVQVVTSETELDQALLRVHGEAQRRQGPLAAAGVTNLLDYQRLGRGEALPPIVLVLDELANLPATTANALSLIVRTDGAYGVHPVVGIQRPDSEVMRGQLKANLATAITLPVVSGEDSRIILHRSGAEKLPKVKGRLLLVWEGRLVEAQAFRVTLPAPQAVSQASCRASLLSDEETRMVAAALDPELDGYFVSGRIAEALGIGEKRVLATARNWAERGWLTGIQYDRSENPPKRLGRQVTGELKKLAGFGE